MSLKRKSAPSDSLRSPKKSKKDVSPSEANTSIVRASQPTNTCLPSTIEFPPQPPGTLRLATWNVCSLASSQKKGFSRYVEAEDPDILVLCETKVNDIPADPALNARFPYRYWSISAKKTYAGTAVLSKHKPISVDKTLPGHPDPNAVKGRIITLEFEGCYIIATYVVNAGIKLKTLDEKKTWNVHFENYIRDLDKKKPVIWTGDLNVAPSGLDLKNDKTNWDKTAGYTKAETTAFKSILNRPPKDNPDVPKNRKYNPDPEYNPDAATFVDVWRQLHPTVEHYTYFSYRFNCRMNGTGWRLDMFVLSEKLVDRVKKCEIRDEIYGASDHCPVILELVGEL